MSDKCLCGIDHKKQQEMAEQFKRINEAMGQFVTILGKWSADMAAALEPTTRAFARLAEIIEPDKSPPFDKTCDKCLKSTFIGGTECDEHAPLPPLPTKDKK